MEGELERPDPTRLRISDDERHKVAEILRVAAGEGRIDLEELDERLEATYAAKTYADLVPITLDLPAHAEQSGGRPTAPRRPSVVVPGPAREQHFAILSGLDRRGVWIVPEQMTVVALMGGANLDLREAKFAAREVVITVNAFMGGAEIIVSPHVNVVIEGVGIMGGYSAPSSLVRADLDDDSPTVRIRGIAIWAGVSVKRKPMPGASRWKRLRRS